MNLLMTSTKIYIALVVQKTLYAMLVYQNILLSKNNTFPSPENRITKTHASNFEN